MRPVPAHRVATTILILALVASVAAGCIRNRRSNLPRSEAPWPIDAVMLVWVGHAEAFRYRSDAWERAPAYDYSFTLVHRRTGRTATAVKTLHRRNPHYSGIAGPRDTALYFEVQFADHERGGPWSFTVRSTLGDGSGLIQPDGASARIEVEPDASFFSPYNQVVLTQQFDFTAGSVEETVLLTKQKDDGDKPFMKFEERAKLFLPSALSGPPWPTAGEAPDGELEE